VIDSESKQPIAGAVVAITWLRRFVLAMDGGISIQRAVEARTEGDGSFAIPNCPGVNWWRPIVRTLDEPKLMIYRAGYEPFPFGPHVDYPFRRGELEPELLRGVTMELPPVRDRPTAVSSARPDALELIGKTRVLYPQVVAEINTARGALGLQLIPSTPPR
jgi:hypothetical protein